MQLHQLKPSYKGKSRKRVGRGGKRGTYSGRGMKGQKSRAGKKPRADFAGGDTPFAKRLPKQRGQVGKVKKVRRGVKSPILRAKPVIVQLKDIERKFKKGEIISPKSLFEKGLVSKIRKGLPKIKILGKVKKDLDFQRIQLTKKIKEKIKKPVKTKS